MDFTFPDNFFVTMPLEKLPVAAIFDCDGTLVDTMPTHYVAWRKTLDDLGYTDIFPENQFYAWGGVPAKEIIERLNSEHRLTLQPQNLADIKEENYRILIPGVQPIIPVVAEAQRFYAAGIPIAVASGGRRDVVEASLNVVGIRALFPVVIGSEDVLHGKPAPDTFLKAAEQLGVPPTSCIVYEDALAGLLAAYRAGMKGVDITRFL